MHDELAQPFSYRPTPKSEVRTFVRLFLLAEDLLASGYYYSWDPRIAQLPQTAQ